MEVALDPSTLGVCRRDDVRARPAQIAHAGELERMEPLVLQPQASGGDRVFQPPTFIRKVGSMIDAAISTLSRVTLVTIRPSAGPRSANDVSRPVAWTDRRASMGYSMVNAGSSRIRATLRSTSPRGGADATSSPKRTTDLRAARARMIGIIAPIAKAISPIAETAHSATSSWSFESDPREMLCTPSAAAAPIADHDRHLDRRGQASVEPAAVSQAHAQGDRKRDDPCGLEDEARAGRRR